MKRTVKVAIIPGKVVKVDVEGNKSARELFSLAGLQINDNMVINAGSNVIGLDDVVVGDIVVASAKIKGNSPREIKVAIIPGKVEKIMVEGDVTARRLFELAGLSVSENMTINAGSEVINLDDTVRTNIVVASAKIKGNNSEYKVDKDYDDSDLMLLDMDHIKPDKDYTVVNSTEHFVQLKEVDSDREVVVTREQFDSIFVEVIPYKEGIFDVEEEVVEATWGEPVEVIKTSECACGGTCSCDDTRKKLEQALEDEKTTLNMYYRWIKETEIRIELLEKLLSK